MRQPSDMAISIFGWHYPIDVLIYVVDQVYWATHTEDPEEIQRSLYTARGYLKAMIQCGRVTRSKTPEA